MAVTTRIKPYRWVNLWCASTRRPNYYTVSMRSAAIRGNSSRSQSANTCSFVIFTSGGCPVQKIQVRRPYRNGVCFGIPWSIARPTSGSPQARKLSPNYWQHCERQETNQMKLIILFVVVVAAILVWWLRSVKPGEFKNSFSRE
jgi:hypothetical protein